VSAARRVLERLLRRAERARLRGEADLVSVSMSGTRDAAEYLALRTLEEFEAFHADIVLAERDGAVIAERERRSGDGSKLRRLTVADLSALARHLDVELIDARVEAARVTLSPWAARFPVVEDVLEAWRRGGTVRGRGVDGADDLAAAAHAAAARLDDAGGESILRRESVRLFGDSKRLERLTRWLEVLVAGELTASGLEDEDVWAALGLRRQPQPLLLAGSGTVELDEVALPLVRPYLGVPTERVRALRTPAGYLLTIENLASFHDAASVAGPEALLLYTGGMPSPAWRRMYVRVLAGLTPSMPLLHWGDIDEGGFRIAAVLSRTAADAGRVLRPWMMAPSELPTLAARTAIQPSAAALSAMTRCAERAGWPALAEDLRRHPLQLEQEALPALLPATDRSGEAA